MKKNLLYLGLTGYLLFALCTRLQAQTDSLQAHRYVTRATHVRGRIYQRVRHLSFASGI